MKSREEAEEKKKKHMFGEISIFETGVHPDWLDAFRMVRLDISNLVVQTNTKNVLLHGR
jgi:hypothetical protein